MEKSTKVKQLLSTIFLLSGIIICAVLQANPNKQPQLSETDTIIVITSHNGFLYAGIDNYIEINQKFLPYKNIIVEVAKGIVMQDEDYYMLMVGRPGNTTLSVYQYDMGDTVLVFRRNMIIKAVPAPYIAFNGSKLDDLEAIQKQQLLVVKRFEVKISEDLIDDDDWFQIKNITVGYPYGKMYITKSCEGAELSKEILDEIATIAPGKEIAFAFTLTASGDVYKRIPPIRLKLN